MSSAQRPLSSGRHAALPQLTSWRTQMRKLLMTAAALLTLAACTEVPATTAQAKDLPACDSETVLKTFIKVSNAVYTDHEEVGVKLRDNCNRQQALVLRRLHEKFLS
jgi:uncharacterized lipoprotein YajG